MSMIKIGGEVDDLRSVGHRFGVDEGDDPRITTFNASNSPPFTAVDGGGGGCGAVKSQKNAFESLLVARKLGVGG